MNYAVMSFRPSFCPCCGCPQHFPTYAAQDWAAGASRQCKCGTMFQLAPESAVLDAAAKQPHGDMAQCAIRTR